MNKDWNSVKKIGLPELEEVTTTNFSSVVLCQDLVQIKMRSSAC